MNSSSCHTVRTGHSNLNSHFKRIGIKASSLCLCRGYHSTARHLLHSTNKNDKRQSLAPESLRKCQVLGSRQAVEFTACPGQRIHNIQDTFTRKKKKKQWHADILQFVGSQRVKTLSRFLVDGQIRYQQLLSVLLLSLIDLTSAYFLTLIFKKADARNYLPSPFEATDCHMVGRTVW